MDNAHRWRIISVYSRDLALGTSGMEKYPAYTEHAMDSVSAGEGPPDIYPHYLGIRRTARRLATVCAPELQSIRIRNTIVPNSFLLAVASLRRNINYKLFPIVFLPTHSQVFQILS